MKPPDYLNEEQKLVWMHGHIAGFNQAMDLKQNWLISVEDKMAQPDNITGFENMTPEEILEEMGRIIQNLEVPEYPEEGYLVFTEEELRIAADNRKKFCEKFDLENTLPVTNALSFFDSILDSFEEQNES